MIYPWRTRSKKSVNYMENFLAFLFCTGNGAQISYNLLRTNYFGVTDWNFLLGLFCMCIVNMLYSFYMGFYFIGSALFIIGLWINIDSDNRLLKLRKNKDNDGGYKVPQGEYEMLKLINNEHKNTNLFLLGGFFEYVSAANYFGECLEWTGFALAAWNISASAFAWFTWSNIGPRAYHHHL